jgi:hypothetical protein
LYRIGDRFDSFLHSFGFFFDFPQPFFDLSRLSLTLFDLLIRAIPLISYSACSPLFSIYFNLSRPWPAFFDLTIDQIRAIYVIWAARSFDELRLRITSSR